MDENLRWACYDPVLRLEACRFSGTVQPFPNHFHDHYVLGLVQAGARTLQCRGETWRLGPGSLLLLAPGDSHGCDREGGDFRYASLNVPPETMEAFAGGPVRFSVPVAEDAALAGDLAALHGALGRGGSDLGRQEAFGLLVQALAARYGGGEPAGGPCRAEVETACQWMAAHYAERVRLEDLCACAHLSRSTLLRAFTQSKGVTPYRYLQSVRVQRARTLLEQGLPPAEAALAAGFADQSHFSRAFRGFLGLSPAAYRAIFPNGGKG